MKDRKRVEQRRVELNTAVRPLRGKYAELLSDVTVYSRAAVFSSDSTSLTRPAGWIKGWRPWPERHDRTLTDIRTGTVVTEKLDRNWKLTAE